MNTTTRKRRTPRIGLTAPLQVSGRDVEGVSFTINAKATSLNRNGAALHLNRDVSLGSVVAVRNDRGCGTSARVVTQVMIGEGDYMYGLELVDEADKLKDFWGIAFPLSRK